MGGSSGGGSSSGKVDFPAHMKVAHRDWLDDTGVDNMAFSVVDLMNTAMAGDSPYVNYTPKDPNEAFFAAGNDLTSYNTPYEILKTFDDWGIEAVFDTYFADDEAKITAAIIAHSAQLDDEVNVNILPKFKAGMVNINATMGSAFVIGEAVIWEGKMKQVALADAKIRLQRIQEGSDIALKRMNIWSDWKRVTSQMATEMARIYLAASFERDNNELEKAHKDKVWDLEMYAYGTQVMACISGTASTVTEMPKQSAMGGAIAGAASGAAIGATLGPQGAAIGGVIGGIAGLLG